MNIAIFTNNYFPNTRGVTTYISTLKKYVEKKGHHVYVFAPKYRGYKDTEDRIIRRPAISSASEIGSGLNIPITSSRKNQNTYKLQHPNQIKSTRGVEKWKIYNCGEQYFYW